MSVSVTEPTFTVCWLPVYTVSFVVNSAEASSSVIVAPAMDLGLMVNFSEVAS